MKNIISSLIIMLSLAAHTVVAQSPLIGTWQNTKISTATLSAVGIGTTSPLGHVEIGYCNDQEYGLVISKRYCGKMIIPTSLYTRSFDGVASPEVEFPLVGTPFGPPMSFFLQGYASGLAKPLIWARTENPVGLTGSGPFTTQFLVTPYGRAGINIENPRATLDIKGLGGLNMPTVIIGRQSPGTADRTAHVHFVNLLGENGYNSLTKQGDQGLFFTDGLGTDGANQLGAFIIAPWTEFGSKTGGIRIDHNGNIDLAGDVRTRHLKIRVDWWSDYVFKHQYQLMPLLEVERYIQINGHLPGISSEKELIENGGDVGELLAIQMAKIEELTLYCIELQKQVDELKKKEDESN